MVHRSLTVPGPMQIRMIRPWDRTGWIRYTQGNDMIVFTVKRTPPVIPPGPSGPSPRRFSGPLIVHINSALTPRAISYALEVFPDEYLVIENLTPALLADDGSASSAPAPNFVVDRDIRRAINTTDRPNRGFDQNFVSESRNRNGPEHHVLQITSPNRMNSVTQQTNFVHGQQNPSTELGHAENSRQPIANNQPQPQYHQQQPVGHQPSFSFSNVPARPGVMGPPAGVPGPSSYHQQRAGHTHQSVDTQPSPAFHHHRLPRTAPTDAAEHQPQTRQMPPPAPRRLAHPPSQSRPPAIDNASATPGPSIWYSNPLMLPMPGDPLDPIYPDPERERQRVNQLLNLPLPNAPDDAQDSVAHAPAALETNPEDDTWDANMQHPTSHGEDRHWDPEPPQTTPDQNEAQDQWDWEALMPELLAAWDREDQNPDHQTPPVDPLIERYLAFETRELAAARASNPFTWEDEEIRRSDLAAQANDANVSQDSTQHHPTQQHPTQQIPTQQHYPSASEANHSHAHNSNAAAERSTFTPYNPYNVPNGQGDDEKTREESGL
ncbi:hypothetical protein BT63DRAFT_467794 [Microthyrium microscopicum]|uniref:Uncharacterized protein n=1 Tax=Microthyrium microscopicum TaxID=703497 RepID=A0A6A6ULB3_9PEZI|nr:hypothetical protein BT63DRAFT_467794 [Microthyrium microscopicum]